jgi:hypothetical protein
MRKHHTMSCPYPEGCSCGAAEYNNLLDQLSRQEQELATLRAKAKASDDGVDVIIYLNRDGQPVNGSMRFMRSQEYLDKMRRHFDAFAKNEFTGLKFCVAKLIIQQEKSE